MGTVAASVLLRTLLQNSVSKLLQRFCRGGCKPILTGCRLCFPVLAVEADNHEKER
jgi:hypothetical protein